MMAIRIVAVLMMLPAIIHAAIIIRRRFRRG